MDSTDALGRPELLADHSIRSGESDTSLAATTILIVLSLPSALTSSVWVVLSSGMLGCVCTVCARVCSSEHSMFENSGLQLCSMLRLGV